MKLFHTVFPLFSGLVFLFLSISAEAAKVVVTDLRTYQAPDHLRLVLDITRAPEYRLFTLSDPDRIVIDIDDAGVAKVLTIADAGAQTITKVRTGKQGKSGLRVVLDLQRPVRARTFLLGPAGQYGNRLVIDLHDKENERKSVVKYAPTKKPVKRDWLIAIDAGHGGEDPGAIGRRYRTKEKKVVLATARQLKRLVDREPGMRSLMIRDGDYYVGLGDRPKIAQKHCADIFISIHADAVPRKRARGSSVYAVTAKGASDNMAKYLAKSENSADLLGGVFSGSQTRDRTLRKVLYDLSATASIGFSLDLGKDIMTELKRVGPVHRSTVGQAGFAVLKSPEFPSVLVETAFISNPTEEKKLRNAGFQKRVAKGILNGVKRFIARKKFSPRQCGTRNNQGEELREMNKPRQHIVRRGESLTSIARKYNINIDSLKFANNISGNRLIAGKKLLIP